jgi:hypothetical protein
MKTAYHGMQHHHITAIRLIKQASFVIAVIPYTRRTRAPGDLDGKKLLHLQCNAGQDTLNLAKFGAIVTGSRHQRHCHEFARQLSKDSGIPGNHSADVFDWLDEAILITDRHDIVFFLWSHLLAFGSVSLGRSNLKILSPGGKLVLMEFHPYTMIFERTVHKI